MNLVRQKRYGPVEAFTLGYGPLGPPLMNVTFYRVDGLLIDTGQRHMQRAALELVRDKKIAEIVLTHHHEDHSGNAAAISRQCGVEVRGHPYAVQKMMRGFSIRAYQRFVWGRAPQAQARPLGPVVDTERHSFLPLHTPGHSRDHTVFWEAGEGWLFAGDLFLGERIKFFREDEILDEQIASLKRVLACDFDALFCAHNPVPAGGKARLSAKVDFLEALRETVRRLQQQGKPLEEIVRDLDRKKDRWVKIITCGNASFANMVRSALAVEDDRAPHSCRRTSGSDGP